MKDREIFEIMLKNGDLESLSDMYYLLKEVKDKSYGVKLKEALEGLIPTLDDQAIIEADKLYEKVLLMCSPFDFESFLLYMEWGREEKSKFYAPRRNPLKKVVSEMQRLADGELELLAVSMPPGTGKSTLGTFFLVWLAGRNPELPNLMFSHNGEIVSGVYKECLRFMTDQEYRFKDIFKVPIVSTNAKNLRIDLGEGKKFETLEFTSVGSQNAGAFRAMSLLYCDDLVDGFETAMSVERLNKLWGEYTVDARQRKQGENCVELHIATRWSVNDPIGRLAQMYEGNDRAKFLVIPALNEKDESNFDYPYGLGFSTKMYLEQRNIMDEISWGALYQGEPIERSGQLYSEDKLMRYFDLPDSQPEAIISICDTKDKGDDYAFLPVFYQYGEMFYLEDCVFDNGKPNVVDARLVNILDKHNVDLCQFESNSAGGRIAKEVEKKLRERGKKTRITTKFTTSNKETKIVVNSKWIEEHIYFKDKSLYRPNSDYGTMIRNLCSYSMVSKNKHDDAPDGLAMFAEYIAKNTRQVTAFKRPF